MIFIGVISENAKRHDRLNALSEKENFSRVKRLLFGGLEDVDISGAASSHHFDTERLGFDIRKFLVIPGGLGSGMSDRRDGENRGDDRYPGTRRFDKRVSSWFSQSVPSLACLLLLVMCSVSSRVAQADFVRTQLDEAQALLSKHKWAEAAIVLRSAIRREPRSASANADLAKALLYLGRREEALSVLSEAIEQNRGRSRDWLIEQNRVIAKIFVTNATFQSYQDGVDLLSVGKFRPAREKFEQVLLGEPYNAEVLTRIGQAYLLDGDHDSAAERLKISAKTGSL